MRDMVEQSIVLQPVRFFGAAGSSAAGIYRTYSMNTQTDKHPGDNKGSSNFQLNPGDEATPGTPGTGENICEMCHGSGKTASGSQCPNCGGTGKVIEGIGGG